MTKHKWASVIPALVFLSGLGDILQAGGCRDAVIGVLQVLHYIGDPHTVHQTPFPRVDTPGISDGHKVNLAFTGSAIFSSSKEGVFNTTKILPPGSFSVL